MVRTSPVVVPRICQVVRPRRESQCLRLPETFFFWELLKLKEIKLQMYESALLAPQAGKTKQLGNETRAYACTGRGRENVINACGTVIGGRTHRGLHWLLTG